MICCGAVFDSLNWPDTGAGTLFSSDTARAADRSAFVSTRPVESQADEGASAELADDQFLDLDGTI